MYVCVYIRSALHESKNRNSLIHNTDTIEFIVGPRAWMPAFEFFRTEGCAYFHILALWIYGRTNRCPKVCPVSSHDGESKISINFDAINAVNIYGMGEGLTGSRCLYLLSRLNALPDIKKKRKVKKKHLKIFDTKRYGRR